MYEDAEDAAADHGVAEDLATTTRELTAEEWRTLPFEAIKTRLGLREIVTPGDGHCFQAAVHAMKAQTCASVLARTRQVASEIDFWRANLPQHLIKNLQRLITNGSMSLGEASHTLLGVDVVDENTEQRIFDHLMEEAAIKSGSPVGARFWGTGLHIIALVHWCQEPVYVFSVLGPATGERQWEAVVQRYSYNLQEDSVATETLSIAETVAQLRVYAAKKVLPLLLVLHHRENNDGTNASHFQALRVDDKFYSAWSGPKSKAKAMAKRLREVVDILRTGTEQSVEEQVLTQTSAPILPDTSSEYTPSEPSEPRPKSSPPIAPPPAVVIDLLTPLAPIVAHDEDQMTSPDVGKDSQPLAAIHEVHAEDRPEPTGQKLAPAPPGLAVSLALEMSPSSLFSLESLSQTGRSSMSCSPATPLTTDQLDDLLNRLQAAPALEPEDSAARALQQATVANRLSYSTWRQKLKGPEKDVFNELAAFDDVSESLKDDVLRLTQVARNIPYPQVWLAAQSDDIIPHMGRAFACIGTIQMLHRVAADERIQQETAQFCTEWATAIDSSPPLLAYRLARQIDRWNRLRHLVPKQGPRLHMDPEYTARFLADAEWNRLLTFAAMLPEYLRREFRTAPTPQICDGLAL